MKIVASIVLLFFVLFLACPTIVACLEKDKDCTNLCEDGDDRSSSVEEIKFDVTFDPINTFYEMSFLDIENSSSIIVSKNLAKHDLICSSIFIPPPNQV
jgi:hypothetical protein